MADEAEKRRDLRARALIEIRNSGIIEALSPTATDAAILRMREILNQLDDNLIREFFVPDEDNLDGEADSWETAVRQIAGEHHFTPAEQRVLVNLCRGLSVSDQAERLEVSRNTVRTHLQRLMIKSGTHSQTELMGFVFRANRPRSVL